MPTSNIIWKRKGQGVLLGREGDTFHVLIDYQPTENGFTASSHHTTTNAREAITLYADAFSQRLIRDMMLELASEGYNPVTGNKKEKPHI